VVNYNVFGIGSTKNRFSNRKNRTGSKNTAFYFFNPVWNRFYNKVILNRYPETIKKENES